MHLEQTLEVHHVLGQRRAALDQPAAHDPAGIFERLVFVLRHFQKVPVQLEKIGPVERHLDSDHAVSQALEAARVERARQELGKHGEALLRTRIARMALAEDRKTRLAGAVLAGGDVHESLVLQQLGGIKVAEHGIRPQPDDVATGRGLGRQMRRDLDHRRLVPEIIRQLGIEPRLDLRS